MYNVEEIVDGPNERDEFFIKWEGYPDSENTWEPHENLPDDMVEEYLQAIEREEENDARKAAKQGRQKRQRIPGVEVAMVVDPSSAQGKDPSKLPKIPKGM